MLRQQEEEEIKNRREQIRAKLGDREWSVTRRLRVTKQGTYSSSYYINGISSNLSELQEELSSLRINVAGKTLFCKVSLRDYFYEVRERREIIDELRRGCIFRVRKINQSKRNLNYVYRKRR